jgi:hypothetical protein
LGRAKCPHCRHHVDLRTLNRVADGDERWDLLFLRNWASGSLWADKVVVTARWISPC